MRFKINPYNQSRKLVIGRILSIHTILVLFFPLIIAPRIQSFCSLKFVYRDFPNRQTTICFTNFNIKLNLIALIKTRIINHSALHYHQMPKKCPTSPPTILPVFMRLCRLFILFILKSHFPHS